MRMLRFAGCLGLGFALAAQAQVGAKRPMTFEDLMAMKRVGDPQISPGGKWVMFSVTDVSLAANTKVNHLWVVPIGGGKERDLGLPAGASNGRFSPDGKWVSFTATDDAGSQIWLVGWDEGAGAVRGVKRLTSLATEADGAIWSPDSKSIAFVSEVFSSCSGLTVGDDCNRRSIDRDAHSPTKALVFDSLLYRHWNQYQAPVAQLAPSGPKPQNQTFEEARHSHILMLHVAEPGKVFDLTPPFDWGNAIIAPTFSLGGPLGYAWSPDSREMAFVVNDDKVPAASTNNDIYVIDVTLHDGAQHQPTKAQALGWAPRKISTSPGSDDGPAYSPDGKYIAFRSQARAGFESDRFRLMVFDRLKGTISEIMPEFDRWVDEFVWAPKVSLIYFVAGNKGAEPILTALPEHGGGNKVVGGLLFHNYSETTGEYSDIHLTPDEKYVVAVKMRASSPSEIVRIATGPCHYPDIACVYGGSPMPTMPSAMTESYKPAHNESFVTLTSMNDEVLSRIDLQKLESYWFTGAEGAKVQGFVVRPPGFDPKKKYPVKFLIHGGPQGAWGDAWVLPVESGVDGGERVCGGDGESSGVDGVWAEVCG